MSEVAGCGAHCCDRVRACRFRLLDRLASLVSRDNTDAMPTGTIARPADRAIPVAVGSGSAEEDLAYARAAASDVLASGGKDASVPWRNPQSGANGNITPLDTSYSEDGHPCRIFSPAMCMGRRRTGSKGPPAAARPGLGK